MKKIIFSILLGLFSILSANGQSIQIKTININGIVVVNNSYSFARFTSLMGTPMRTDFNNEDGDLISMTYNGNTFSLFNGIFNSFDIINSSYSINGLISVGDDIISLTALNLFNQKIIQKPSGQKIYYAFLTNKNDDNSPLYLYVTNGIITRMSYVANDGL